MSYYKTHLHTKALQIINMHLNSFLINISYLTKILFSILKYKQQKLFTYTV